MRLKKHIAKDLATMVDDVKQFNGEQRSALASFIWWRLSSTTTGELMDELKAMITYNRKKLCAEDMSKLLRAFGFDAKFVAYNLKSTFGDERRAAEGLKTGQAHGTKQVKRSRELNKI